jgi:hypothetical protein
METFPGYRGPKVYEVRFDAYVPVSPQIVVYTDNDYYNGLLANLP